MKILKSLFGFKKSRLIRIFILIIIALHFNSCMMCNVFSKQFYFEKEGGVRPGKNRFKFRKNPYILKQQDLLKTDCVYLLCSAKKEDKLKDTSKNCISQNSKNQFIRFFKNGRFITNRLDPSKKTRLEQYNNLKRGKVGYYKIVDNELILEYFAVKLGGMSADCGKYYRDKYKMTEKEIILKSERRSASGTFYAWSTVKTDTRYQKINIEGLTGEPNW